MKDITPVILVRSLNFERGGVTKAVIKRANTLATYFKKIVILTTIYQRQFQYIRSEFYKQRILSKNVDLVNFFDDIQKDNNWRFRRKINHPIEEKGYDVIEMPNHPYDSYRYYKDGLYSMYKRFDEDGDLIFIDYRNNSLQRTKREEYCKQGFLSRISHYNTNFNKATFEQYFNKGGWCVLSVHVHPKTKKEGFTVHFDKNTNSYTSLENLQKIWVKNKLSEIKLPVVMSEQRRLDPLLNNLEVKKIMIAHSSHLKAPFNDTNEIAPLYERLFNRSVKYDSLVVLTEAQKRDIQTVYPNVSDIKVIPHSFEVDRIDKEEVVLDRSKTSHNVVMIARYSKAKRIDEAINAFKYVVEKLTDARLFIYGGGPLKDSLHKLINKLDLNKNVFLMGYTDDPKTQYENAACSILTSEREGFGLVITESMAYGTPVVAYDIKYGPGDIIKDGENGFIVENNNQQELANKIIKTLEDRKLQRNLAENAVKIRYIFSEEKYKENWIKLILDLKR